MYIVQGRPIQKNNTRIDVVEEYVYLGLILTITETTQKTELGRRITMGWSIPKFDSSICLRDLGT